MQQVSIESATFAISASNLSVDFEQYSALQNLSFDVGKGEVFAMLGGNGAGKSTTLKTFLGLVKATSGDATVLGHSVANEIKQIRAKVAYLPESVMLYGHLSGIENVRYFLALAGTQRTEHDINAAFDKVALKDSARNSLLSSYSKGMRQKTAIALALLREAPVLFLDEPTSGLDPSAIDEFNTLITKLSAAGTTIFMVTHDVYGACQVAHRIALLNNGELVGSFTRQGDNIIDTESVHAAFAELGK